MRQRLSRLPINPLFTVARYSARVSTLAEIAVSYGVEHIDLSTVVGIAGVNPHAELTDGQASLIVELIEASDLFPAVRSGRHRF